MQKKQLVIALLSLWLTDVLAAESVYSSKLASLANNNLANEGGPIWHAGPWTPRITNQGLFSRQQFAGFMDGMVPILGTAERMIYLDGSLMGGRFNSFVGSMGAGMRQLTNVFHQDVILGGFFFTDLQRMQNQQQNWIANPGIELLTRHQEVRLQGYIPMGHRTQAYRALMASEIPQWVIRDSGKTNTLTSLQGHSISDTPVSLTHENGIGIEGEIGQYIPIKKGAWLRVGGYHFDYNHAQSINGVEANLEVFAGKNLSIILQDNYDNQYKNKFSLGLRLTFGGPDNRQLTQLANRMEEPIIRHLARQPSGLATPVRDSYIATGPTQFTNDIWFFSPNGTYQPVFSLASCTAENPCINLDQTIANGITSVDPAGALLWFAPGTYALAPTSNGGNGLISASPSSVVYLGDGQQLYGRSADFKAVATANNQPTIYGGLAWNGSGSFNNMNINNAGQLNTLDGSASALIALGDLTVNQANIIATSNTFTLGVNATNAMVNNSSIAITGTGAAQIFAVSANNNVTVTSSTISSTSTGADQFNMGVAGFGDGVIVENSNIMVSGSQFPIGINNYEGFVLASNTLINVTGNVSNPNCNLNGIFAESGLTASGMTINVANTGTSQALALVNNQGDINFSNSVLNVSSAGSPVSVAANGGDIIVSNSTINTMNTANAGFAEGLFALNNITASHVTLNTSSSSTTTPVIGLIARNGNISVADSLINASGNGSVYGAQAAGAGDVRLSDSVVNVSDSGGGGATQLIGVQSFSGGTSISGGSINVQSTSPLAAYVYGVWVNTGATLNNVSITATNMSTVATQTWGVLTNAGDINLSNSVLNVSSVGTPISVEARAGDIIVSNSTINTTNTGNAGFAQGLLAFNNIVASNLTLNINASSTSPVYGIGARNGNITLADSLINASGNGPVYGVQAAGAGDVRLSDSVVNVSGSGGGGATQLIGVQSFSGGTSISGGSINVQSTSPLAAYVYGVWVNTGATLNNVSITATNMSTVATQTWGVLTNTGNINFDGGMSTVSVSSAVPATSVAVSAPGGMVNNNSTPKSSCSVNGGAAANCA